MKAAKSIKNKLDEVVKITRVTRTTNKTKQEPELDINDVPEVIVGEEFQEIDEEGEGEEVIKKPNR